MSLIWYLAGASGALVVGEEIPDFYPHTTRPVAIGEVIFSPSRRLNPPGVQRDPVALRLGLENLGDGPIASLSGLLVYQLEGEKELQFRQVSLDIEPQSGVAPPAAPKVDLLGMSFDTGEEAAAVWVYFVWAALGGLILNLMPCVLPVISLKVMGFVGQAGQERGRIRQLGFAFVGGIVATFLALALVVVALKAGGEQVGWGFQFQAPGFVIFMAGLVFLLGLSLFGVYEILLPGMRGGGEGEGVPASFFNGVLATVLATPCTAPFLGTALGFAFSQSAGLIFGIFFAIGLGMGLPYVLLALEPGWMRFIPKPGPWMVQFKQAMGFLLMATVLWLLWVLGKQLGMEPVIWTSAFLLCLGIGGWIVGQWIDLRSGRGRRFTVWGIALGIGIGAYLVLVAPLMEEVEATQGAGAEGGELTWLPFSVPALEQLIGDGHTVFIDFTADWCFTCKVNERTVLADREVKARFEELEVKLVKADWTSEDPQITALLQKFGRSGVPLYVIFSGGRADAPLVLPEVITKGIVLEKLAEAVRN